MLGTSRDKMMKWHQGPSCGSQHMEEQAKVDKHLHLLTVSKRRETGTRRVTNGSEGKIVQEF